MWTNAGASRTLDPADRSLVTVVGLHEKQLSDADVNLVQSLQDWKRKRVLANTACSGALSYAPFVYSARTNNPVALQFSIPAFDVLMNGDVVKIAGNGTADLTTNVVSVPSPSFWSPGSSAAASSLYIAYIEFWYQRLEPVTGLGYYRDPTTGLLYFFPQGCVNAPAVGMIANDTLDPFVRPAQQETTERVQLQWAIRVTPVDSSYDFAQYAFGLDAGATTAQTVFAQAGQSAPQSSTPYQFINMAAANGDAGLWRAGDGNYLNELATVDGYSYAMPLAVIFQRNTGVYSVDQNPFGSADPKVAGSGLLASGWTSRYDFKFADVVFPEDVIDTRSLVALDGWDEEELLRRGFVDVISGQTRLAITRGETPGNLPAATGSLLDYAVTIAPSGIANTNTVGAFDGYRNGFSSADQTFYSIQTVTVNQKTSGNAGMRWKKGDSFTVSLPGTSNATIEYLQVQGLVTDAINAVKAPVLYLTGQISITGLGTKTATVTFAADLSGTSYDPGINPLYVTLGVEYPAQGGVDLVHVPNTVYGGKLLDTVSSKTLPVYAVSSYATTAFLPGSTTAYAYNPSYSDVIFGTRVPVLLAGNSGVPSHDASGNPITTFTLNRTGLSNQLKGLYVVSASDQSTGASYTIVGRSISGNNFILQLQGTVPSTSTVVATFLALDTVQASYNAPVKAVTIIEETVLTGTVRDSGYTIDPRISIVSVKNYAGVNNSVVIAATGGTLTGLAGDDVNKLIWVKDTTGNYNAVQISSAILANGFITITVPATVNLEVQPFFLVASFLPTLPSTSQLTLIENYVPYQGEGHTGRDYEVVHTEDVALITTNGTGVAPVPGLKDIYPYNREVPVAATLPSQAAWNDASLLNQPVASVFDSNYVAKSFQNVEHTIEVPAHTNDFIEPVSDGKRRTFQLSVASGSRGYAKATPHMGFAVNPLTPKLSLGASVTSTSTAIMLYVNNVTGNDANDGLSIVSPLKTIQAALNALPSVLRHPCSIQLIPTGQAYSIASLANTLQVVALGDGVVRSAKYYALGAISFTIQDMGRLVITAQAGTSGRITIDATGFTGFGDGPTAAFFIDNSRVIFNQIEFKGFSDPAVKGLDANIEFVNCAFTQNLTGGSFEQGSTVVLDGGTVTLGAAGNGFILSQSELGMTGTTLAVQPGTQPGAFFVAERTSSLSLDNHSATLESNVAANTVIAEAELNSSIVVTANFTSQGRAAIFTNSVLSRTVSVTPFSGGINQDSSSSVVTSL